MITDLERLVALGKERASIEEQIAASGLLERRDALTAEIEALQAKYGLAKANKPNGGGNKVRMQRVLSAEARKAMSDAQSRRWARQRAAAAAAITKTTDDMVATVQG